MFEMIPWFRSRSALSRPKSDLLDWMFEGFEAPDFWRGDSKWLPAFDVSETEETIIVKAELAGMDAKEIDITLTEGILTIKGEKKREKEDTGENYHRLERRYGSFVRSFRLPVEVKTDAIDASYKDGVLTLSLPKLEEKKAKRIEVKS